MHEELLSLEDFPPYPKEKKKMRTAFAISSVAIIDL